jgi:hypothetical protein
MGIRPAGKGPEVSSNQPRTRDEGTQNGRARLKSGDQYATADITAAEALEA